MSDEKERTDLDNNNEHKNQELLQKDINSKSNSQKSLQSKPVVIKAEAYKTIILYASRYANKSLPPEQWKEVYGILIGYSDDEFVYVERAEALTFGHATDVQLNEKHYGFIEQIQEKLDEEGKNYYIVGWFHSHPGLSLFFSYIDLINQLGFQQNNPDFCGLVFDHTLLGKKKEEIVKSEDGTEHSLTKYDTGFEIYRITDVNLDVNDPSYDNNYNQVDYIVDGLNKYFFANVLSELSALAVEGKPLQSAYREDLYEKKSKKKKKQINNPSELDIFVDEEFLSEIPTTDDFEFDAEDLFYGEIAEEQKKPELKIREKAEQLIYEGNLAFDKKDAFKGIEKFKEGIKEYKKIKDVDKVMDILRILAQKCIANDHFVLAGDFANDLHSLSEDQNHLFYKGVSNYILGYLLLKKGGKDTLENGLKKIQEAAINFEHEGDFAGAGMCFNKIGTIYQSRLNKIENACLFFREAIGNFNKAILRIHPLRTSFWNKPDLLIQKIMELKDIIEELLPNFDNLELKQKILEDLTNMKYNF